MAEPADLCGRTEDGVDAANHTANTDCDGRGKAHLFEGGRGGTCGGRRGGWHGVAPA